MNSENENIVRIYILRNLAEVGSEMIHVCHLGWKPCLIIIISVQTIKDSILYTSNDITAMVLFYYLSYQQRIIV